MRKMKKILSVALACVLTLGLGACSGSSGGGTTSGAANSAAPAATEAGSSADSAGTTAAAAETKAENSDGPIIVGFLGWSSGADAMYGLVPQHLLETYFKR